MIDIIPFLRGEIGRYADIPIEEIGRLATKVNAMTLRRRDHFINQGEDSCRIAIIYSGFFRFYTTDEAGNEKTLSFRKKGQLLAGYSVFLEKVKTWYSIQALMDSEILYLYYEDYKELERGYPGWVELLKNYMIQLFIEKADRERSFLLEDASTRYIRFLEQYPDYGENLSQYLIASYLGISPVSLSRIRSNLIKSRPAF